MAHSAESYRKIPQESGVIRPTTWIPSDRLSGLLNLDLWFASETFQRTGSFKLRAAYHMASRVPHPTLIAASSGNFGQGLACACQLLGKKAIVVMPETSARVKVGAIHGWGASVDLIDLRRVSRQERVEALARQHPDAYVASAYDDPLVIEGNASLGAEVAGFGVPFDVVLAPVGGGGLTAGLIQGLRRAGRSTTVWAVEPERANDAARSFRSGQLVSLEQEPETIADGVRTVSLGQHNWAILKTGLAGVIEVSESDIADAVRRLFLEVNLKAEPTGSLALAGLLKVSDRFAGQKVCCVISGGNVDAAVYARLLGG